MIVQRLRPWLTRLYPRDWRERYADEFDALLEQSLHTPLDVLDVFLGAMDARLQLLNGENVNWRKLNTMNKLRTAILVVFTAFIGFVIAGFALVGIADDSPMVPLMQTNTALSVSWKLIQAGAVIALLAILVGGLPLWITLVRQAFKVNRRMIPLLVVPDISLLVLLAYAAFVFLVSTGRIGIPGVVQVVQGGTFPPGNRLLLSGLILVFILGAVASTWAVWKVVTSVDDDSATFRPVGQKPELERLPLRLRTGGHRHPGHAADIRLHLGLGLDFLHRFSTGVLWQFWPLVDEHPCLVLWHRRFDAPGQHCGGHLSPAGTEGKHDSGIKHKQ